MHLAWDGSNCSAATVKRILLWIWAANKIPLKFEDYHSIGCLSKLFMYLHCVLPCICILFKLCLLLSNIGTYTFLYLCVMGYRNTSDPNSFDNFLKRDFNLLRIGTQTCVCWLAFSYGNSLGEHTRHSYFEQSRLSCQMWPVWYVLTNMY